MVVGAPWRGLVDTPFQSLVTALLGSHGSTAGWACQRSLPFVGGEMGADSGWCGVRPGHGGRRSSPAPPDFSPPQRLRAQGDGHAGPEAATAQPSLCFGGFLPQAGPLSYPQPVVSNLGCPTDVPRASYHFLPGAWALPWAHEQGFLEQGVCSLPYRDQQAFNISEQPRMQKWG